MELKYKTHGTCSQRIDLVVEDGIIKECTFIGGCRGNTQGLSRTVIGRDAREIMNMLRGIPCRGNSSCPDQLSRAIEAYLKEE